MIECPDAELVLDINHAGHDAWLAARRNGITGSDTLALLGLDPRKSPVQLYLEKTENLDMVVENDHMRAGRYLEPAIAQWFADDTGMVVEDPKVLLRSRDYPLLLASPDRLIHDGGSAGLLEIKSTSHFLADDWEDGPPLRALAQTAHYLGVTGLKWAAVAVLIGGWQFRWFRVERNDTLIADILERELEWWHTYVEKHQMPPIDESDSTADALKEMWPEATEGRQIELSMDLREVWDEYTALKASVAADEKRVKGMRSRLAAHLMDAEYATFGGTPLFSYKSSVQHRIDTDALRDAHPDIAEKFTKEIPVRTMRAVKVGK